MELSESQFLEIALERGNDFVRSMPLVQQPEDLNAAWSEFCKSLLHPTRFLGADLMSYMEKLTTIERIYSASLVYAMAQSKVRRRALAMYFTPPALSDYVLDRVESFGADFAKHRFIDPAAGGASFIGPIASRMSDRGATAARISQALHGVEIDPALADFARAAASCVVQIPVDRLVTCGDGLVEGKLDSFDVVIGNPPYRVLSPTQRKKMPGWAKHIFGSYANLYSLFIVRGIQLLKPDGLLALLVPTSFITGNYFRSLRKYITQNSTVLALDLIEQRKEFFRDVSQDVCLLVCQKATANCREYSANSRTIDREIFWRHENTYRIKCFSEAPWLRNMQGSSNSRWETLESLGYTVRCGPIVHNRDKGLSEGTRRRKRSAVPLVWGHAIRPYTAVEPAPRNRQTRDGAITLVSTHRNTPPVTVPSIVLQRTNSGDQEKRIRAGFVGEPWINKYGGFYGENHVVVISPDPTKKQRCSLQGLLKLISSNAVDSRLRPLLSSNSINVTAMRALQLPKLSERKLSIIESFDDSQLEAAIEEGYG